MKLIEDLKFTAIANGALLLSRLACWLEGASDWLYQIGLSTPEASKRYEQWCYRQSQGAGDRDRQQRQ